MHIEAARGALLSIPADPHNAEFLAHHLHDLCRAPLVEALTRPAGDMDKQAIDSRDGMTLLDANLAAWWETVSPEEAQVVRRSAHHRHAEFLAGQCDAAALFAKWGDGGLPRLTSIARTLWQERVQFAAQTARRVVAYPKPLVTNLALLIAPQPNELFVKVDGDTATIFARGGQAPVACRELDAARAAALAQGLARGGPGASRLGEPDALKLLVFLQDIALVQLSLGHGNHREISIAGPWRSELAERAGLSVDGRKNVEAYLTELQEWRWAVPGYKGLNSLLAWRLTATADLVVTLSPLGAGEWVDELRQLGESVPPALLAAVPLPAAMWPVSAVPPRARQKASRFVLEIWLALHRQRARVEFGAVDLDAEGRAIAARCGLAVDHCAKLLDDWRAAGRLIRYDGSRRWGVGDVHQAERAFLIEAALRSKAGRARYDRSKKLRRNTGF